jgi:hypothetical protein
VCADGHNFLSQFSFEMPIVVFAHGFVAAVLGGGLFFEPSRTVTLLNQLHTTVHLPLMPAAEGPYALLFAVALLLTAVSHLYSGLFGSRVDQVSFVVSHLVAVAFSVLAAQHYPFFYAMAAHYGLWLVLAYIALPAKQTQASKQKKK